jgi:hypothetical protein
MSNDLEDFLRRAAQRRQEKAAATPTARPVAPLRPEYAQAQSERQPRQRVVEDDDEPVDAIIVEESENPYGIHAISRVVEKIDQPASHALSGNASSSTTSSRTSVVTGGTSPSTVNDLIRLLSGPGGMQQAILLREILDRPEHRWD